MTPPTFLVQAEDDPIDPVQNSLVYYAALKQAGVLVEMHLYAHGGHGFGLRRTGFRGSAPTELCSLLSRADAALYAAKSKGRNRVEFEPDVV